MKRDAILGSVGGVSGAASIISSAQTCNTICVSGFSTLSVAGTAMAGLPLVFSYLALPAWWLGVGLFALLAGLFVFEKGVKPAFLLLNGGILLAGTPFLAVHGNLVFFWIAGGLLAVAGAGMLLWARFAR
jgi:hypothetical protein